MLTRIKKVFTIAPLLTLALGGPIAAAARPVADTPPGAGMSPMRFEIDISERKLYVYHGDDVQTYPVAVGMPEYPTPTGDFTISQVTFNPDWQPPNSEWSKDEDYKEPDEEGNPMGRAKLMFQAPDYTIHGTDDYDSLGKNVSHGSVRISNKVVTDLARRAMVHGGTERSEEWYKEAAKNDSDQHIVKLSNPLPISIRE